jgi:hypothetical protein
MGVGEIRKMKSVALLTLALLTASCVAASYDAATARPYRGHHYVSRATHHVNRDANRASESDSHAGITCEMVRAYVAQVGLAQAVAMAESAGITSSEKERARRCLQKS